MLILQNKCDTSLVDSAVFILFYSNTEVNSKILVYFLITITLPLNTICVVGYIGL